MFRIKSVAMFLFCLCFSAFVLNSGRNCAAFELTPEGEKLYKQWVEVIGYSAIDLVKKMDPAPEIKPGMEITPQNAKDYPGLKKLMPESMYRRLDPKHFLPMEKITIVETRPRYYPQEVINGTRECLKNVKLNKNTLQIEGYIYGLPFPRVSDPLHVIWNHVIANLGFEENVWFDPFSIANYTDGKVDSLVQGTLGRYRVMGRLYTDIGPNRESAFFKGQGIMEQGTLLITYPADLKGTAFLRTRYWDVDKDDHFVSYLPGLKRIRVLSGTDAQDPIAGSEITWDEWAVEWQKQPSKKIFPNEYKILGTQVMLLPVYPSKAALPIQGQQFTTIWEKRPVWVLEIKSLDSAYSCSKRIMYADMEHFKAAYQEYYDRRGALWRTWVDFRYMLPDGQATWEGSDVLNHITKRQTVLKMNASPNPPVKPEQFDMRWLIKMAR